MTADRGLMRRSAPYLLDTHIWLWYLTGFESLRRDMRQVIDAARDELWLSPVSVWEVGMLVARGRVRIAGAFRDWLREATDRVPVHDATLTREVAVTGDELQMPHRDPADRFIAATALVYELTLLTVDERLTGAEWLPTL